MTDNELEAILKEIEKKANAKASSDSAETDEKTEPAPVKEEPEIVETVPQPETPETRPQPEAVEPTVEEILQHFDTEKAKTETEETKTEVGDTAYEEDLVLEEVEKKAVEEFVEPAEEDEESKEPVVIAGDDSKEVKNGKNKKPLIIVIAIILIIAIAAGIYFGFFQKKEDEPTTSPRLIPQPSITEINEDKGAMNPLTGEYGYNQAAVGKRPVAVVVENEYSTESVRPQWGLNKADIVLEGESEFSTRLLLFYADYTNVPEQVGPTRSARPPFIRFSKLFDAPFIHAGLSHSKGNYIGADTVFTSDNVDHYNLLSGSEGGRFFARDKSRTSTIEHTGYLKGENIPALFEAKEWRTDINEAKFSVLPFNEEAKEIGTTPAMNLEFNWSDVYSTGKCPKVGHFTYNSEKRAYTTTDFDSQFGTADLEFANLVFLLDKTEYVVKENYKNSGSSETYCDYKLSGGKGVIASMGTQVEITWGVDSGKLWMKDADGNTVSLNPGKTYIGYGSSNHGGTVKTIDSAE